MSSPPSTKVPCSSAALAKQQIATERLSLQPWLRADLDTMAAWPPFTEPLEQNGNWAWQFQEQGMLDLFFWSRINDSTRMAWTIRAGDNVIGLLQLSQVNPATQTAHLGLGFGAPWVGQGLGHEAMHAFLHTYFERCGWQVLRLEVALHNQRARRLYERLHFIETRRFWQDVGADIDHHTLDSPRYAHLRPYFRLTVGGIYQHCANMELTLDRWHTFLSVQRGL